MVMERTQAGKEIAKTRNDYREGMPPVHKDKMALVMKLIDEDHYSYRKAAEVTGVILSTIVHYRKNKLLCKFTF